MPASMKGAWKRVLPVTAVLAILSHPVLIYWGVDGLSARRLSALFMLSLVPIVLSAVDRGRSHAPLLVVAMAAVAALTLLSNDARVMLSMPVAINSVLFAVFASTLIGSQPSLIERIAAATGKTLSAEQEHYCRRVTIAWCGFFVANATTAALLAAFAPLAWWAVYTGAISYLLVGVVFSCELVLRYYLFPSSRPAVVSRWLDRSGVGVGRSVVP